MSARFPPPNRNNRSPLTAQPTKRAVPRHYGQQYTGSSTRADAFKKCQDLFRNDKNLLADLILSGKNVLEPISWPSIQRTGEYFAKTFEQPSAVANANITDAKTVRIIPPQPITPKEVNKAKIGWKSSAPGLDGVTTDRLKRERDQHLAIVFTAILYGNIQPERFKKSRTTLIYKRGDRADPSNWRPITVSSAILRLFHRVLANRIRQQISLNMNQRGFTQIDDTMANILILETFLKSRAAAASTSAVVGIDVTKAFDTVSHYSIHRGLRRIGMEQCMTNYVMSPLKENRTTVRLGGQSTREITFIRGVKQGDPISPFCLT